MNSRVTFYAIAAALMLAVLSGCTKNETLLNFELPAGMNNPLTVVYYASDKSGGKVIETAVEIRDGRGSVKLPMVNPAVISIFPTLQHSGGLMVYGRRGDKITVTGEKEAMDSWKVSGNELNENYTSWRLENPQASGTADPEVVNRAIERYVEKNTGNPLSLFLLSLRYSRSENPVRFRELYGSLTGDVFKDTKLTSALAAADLTEGLSRADFPVKIFMTGNSGYLDSLELGLKPVMILFRDNSRRRDFEIQNDTIRALSRSYRDSLDSRIVADVFMDSDSLEWRRSRPGDLPAGVRAFWLPGGLADSLALSTGVTRLPYYVVADRKGKILYRGSSLEKAARNFRAAE